MPAQVFHVDPLSNLFGGHLLSCLRAARICGLPLTTNSHQTDAEGPESDAISTDHDIGYTAGACGSVCAIGLMGSGLETPGREALERLADASGGSAFFPESLDQVGEITTALAHDIRAVSTRLHTSRRTRMGT